MGAWEDRVVGKVVRQPFRSYVSGPRSREISKRTHTHTNTHVRVHEHTYTPTHIHTCTQMHAPIYLCTHIYTPRQCVRTHTHTHTHTFAPCVPARQAAQSRDPVQFVETVPPLSQDAVKGPERLFLCKLASGHCKTSARLPQPSQGPFPSARSPSSPELGRFLYPLPHTPSSPSSEQHVQTPAQEGEKEASHHDFISLGQPDQLPLGPLPVIFCAGYLSLLCFVLGAELPRGSRFFFWSDGVLVPGVWGWEK